MKKQPYLFNKFLKAFALVGIWNIFFPLLFLTDTVSPSRLFPNGVILLADLIGNLSFWAWFYWQCVIPYRKIRRAYLHFANGKIYEELFLPQNMMTHELELVMKRFYHLLNKQDAINLSQRQAEYLALQNQINPHFLYNTLEAIRGDALSEGLNSIAETTEALGAFFRYTITDVNYLVTLEDELDNIHNYFVIQQYRFADKIKMEIHYPDNEPDIATLHIPKLTLQPIVENAIFHGLERVKGQGVISIDFESTDTRLFVTVTDNGIGISRDMLDKLNEALSQAGISYVQERAAKKGGIALRNVSRRIKLLFGDEYGLHIFSTPHIGTSVRITIPKLKGNSAYEKRDF